MTKILRFDRRNCSSGYSCGSTCINLKKECQKESGSSIGKERLNKIQSIAEGRQSEGLGLQRLKRGEAGDLAGQIRQRRSQRAAELKAGRQPKAKPDRRGLLPGEFGKRREALKLRDGSIDDLTLSMRLTSPPLAGNPLRKHLTGKDKGDLELAIKAAYEAAFRGENPIAIVQADMGGDWVLANTEKKRLEQCWG